MVHRDEHYLGNPLLKKANTQVELTEEQLTEFVKCIDDPIYFAKNYIKIVTLDDGLVNFEPYQFQEEMLSNFHKKRFNVCKLPRQPLWIETPILTTQGWKTLGQVQIGDYVYDAEGLPVLVTDKTQVYNNTPCYKIVFDCGEEIIADEDHVWPVNNTRLRTIDLYNDFLDGEHLRIKGGKIPDDYKVEFQFDEHFILDIEKVDSVPVVCITVNSDDHLFLCGKSFIPTQNSGKSTTTVAFLVHHIVFNEHTSIAILANKASTAKDILARLQTAYENLPKWMQQGVKSWNKTSMELENGSKVIAASTSASSVRGGTYSLLMLDEYAFVPQQVAENFMRSVYPTITSGRDSKVIVVSCVTKDTYILTPKGYRRIDSLVESDKSGAYFTNDYTVRGRDKFYSSNIVVNSGKASTNIITTRYDSIECSEDHKLWAYCNDNYGYVKSNELKVGDYIALRYNAQVFGDDDSSTVERAKEYGELIRDYNSMDFDFILSDKVLSWIKPNIISLLNGLFDSHSLYDINKNLEFTTTSKELARQVQLLLLNIGLFGELKIDGDYYTITLKYFIADDNLIWLKIKSIEKSENEVFDVSLPDIEDDKWCHSVLYNNFLGHQTPAGLNHYYKLWMDAKDGKNDYHPFEIHWSDVPGRDEIWRNTQIKNIGQKAFDQEFNTDFLGSSETLISGSKLANLVTTAAIKSLNDLDVFVEPKDEHVYVTIVDTARGVEKDYSAFVVMDVTNLPYKVVAKYRSNEIKPEMYSYVIKDVASKYNTSYLLCEVNDIGNQIARDLVEDGYPNMLFCSTKSRSGQFIGQNFSGKYELGVKMQKNIKKVGALNLKTLIEEDKLEVNDYDIFAELTTFIQKGPSFEAEAGKNDDLVVCLLLFAWLTTNQYFKDITNIDLRQRLLAEKKDKVEEEILPFGFIDRSDGVIIDNDTGLIWNSVENQEMIDVLYHSNFMRNPVNDDDESLNEMMNLFNYY